MPQEEIPQPGKAFVLSYDRQDHGFPVVGVLKDIITGNYILPKPGDPISGSGAPNISTYAKHVFAGEQVTKWDQRTVWVYKLFPGPWTQEDKLDNDGVPVSVYTRENIKASITPRESTFVDTNSLKWWKKIEDNPVTDFYSNEVWTLRQLDVNPVPSTAINPDYEPVSTAAILSRTEDVTPGASVTDQTVTTIDKEEVTDLVSRQKTTTWDWVDHAVYSAKIPDFIDARFAGQLPIDSTYHESVGTASQPTLAPGQWDVTQRQLNTLFMAEEVTTRDTSALAAGLAISDTLILKDGMEQTVQFTLSTSVQTLNPSSLDNFAEGQINTLGTDAEGNVYTLKTEVFDTLPSPWVYDEETDEDGLTITVAKRTNLVSAITPSDGVPVTDWVKVSMAGQNGTIAQEVVRTRAATGNPIPVEVNPEEDSDLLSTTKQMVPAGTTVPQDSVVSTSWSFFFAKQYHGTSAVFWLYEQVRVCPGAPKPSTRLDPDGETVSLAETLIEAGTGTTSEPDPSGSTYTRQWVEVDPHSIKVQRQRSEARPVPGLIFTPTSFEANDLLLSSTRQLKAIGDITSSNTENVPSAGFQTKVYAAEYKDSTRLAWEVIEVSILFQGVQYSAKGNSGIPEEFLADIPIQESSSTDFGTAAAPTLDIEGGQLEATSVQQTDLKTTSSLKTRDISSLPTLNAQAYDPRLDIVRKTVRDVVTTGTTMGNAQTKVTPVSASHDLSEVEDISQIQAAMAAFVRGFPGRAEVRMPPVLNSISISVIKSAGAGDGSNAGSGEGAGTNWSYDLKGSNSSEGNASCIPELISNTKYLWEDKPVQIYMGFIAGPIITIDDVIAWLLSAFSVTALEWPNFQTAEAMVLTHGQNVHVRASAEASIHQDSWANDSGAGASNASMGGTEQSYSVENIARVHTFPPCIRGDLVLNDTDSQDVTVTAEVDLTTTTAGPVSITRAANSVATFSIGATPLTDWPDSGLYVMAPDCESTDYGMFMVRVRVYDMANN